MIVHHARVGRDRGTAPYLPLLVLTALLSSSCNRKGAGDYLVSGDEALQNTRLADAEGFYQRAVKAAPGDARPHLALGSLYLFEHKPPQAESELMKALELDPGSAKAHSMLASAYVAHSELGFAEAQSRAAVALSPAKPEYRMDLGTTLQNEQKLGAAEAEYRTAIGLDPRNAHSHLALAALLSSEPNRQNDAQAEYAQVKALDATLITNAATVPAPVNTSTTGPAPLALEAPITQTNKRFVLTHDSPVYESMNNSAGVIAQVHRRRYVHVTGISGDWLRIQLRTGKVGFIPLTAAE